MTPIGSDVLPVDVDRACLVGRVWFESEGGPLPVLVRGGELVDLSTLAPTMSELLETFDVGAIAAHRGRTVGRLADLGFTGARLLAPIDLQCIKACGVTFAISALERVIEERARGNPAAAAEVRAAFEQSLGGALSSLKPGSDAAERLKARLVADGHWSQYLEVAIGPHAEVFTKAPCLSAVGYGANIGVRDDSVWNNPEPEIVLVVNSRAQPVGATLGNDVNLRDIEGRSALLLGKAKDNTASCAVGPFVRLFDEHFTLDDVRAQVIDLLVEGEDGFVLRESVSMATIARDPLDLVAQTCGKHHQYPDGFALFLGTMFAPTKDRDAPNGGFTHKVGDQVTIASPRLGTLRNRVTLTHLAEPWEFGLVALMRNLASRGLLQKGA